MKNTFITQSRLAKLKQYFDNGQSYIPQQSEATTKQFHYKGDAEWAANNPVHKTARFVNGINALKASVLRGGRGW